MTDSLRQNLIFDATPDRVFNALLDSGTFSAMTGAPAEIDSSAGGAFSCFGGAITGRNLEVVRDRRIVQGWRAGPWPEGVFSLVRFELQDDGGKTRLTLNHSAFPEGQGEHLKTGWETNYWSGLRKHLAQA
jgi:activator of HSP90 ATPase